MSRTILRINTPRAACHSLRAIRHALRATRVFIFALATLLACGFSYEASGQNVSAVALLPFENVSGSLNSIPIIMPLVEQSLKAKGYRIVLPEKIEPFLLRHRIRNTGMLSRRHLNNLRQEFAVDLALVGSVELYYESAENPQSGLSSRIISTSEGNILWAESTGRTGGDYTGMLGLGTITSGSALAREVVKILFRTLPTSGSPFPVWQDQGPRKLRLSGATGGYRSPALDATARWRVAVTTFENRSERRGAGLILADVLTTALFQHGRFQVIDPGELNEALITLGRTPYGGIDFATLKELKKRRAIDAIFLGTVYRYNEGLKRETSTSPEIALDIRMVDTESGKILWTAAAERNGDEYRIALDFGIIRSMIPLIRKTMGEMLEML